MLLSFRSRSSMAASTAGHITLCSFSTSVLRCGLRSRSSRAPILKRAACSTTNLGSCSPAMAVPSSSVSGFSSTLLISTTISPKASEIWALPSLSVSLSVFSKALRSSSERLMRRENRCVSITMPSTPEGTSSESFFTSSPARPKMACKSFSSGVNSVLLLGETLPTRISPDRTYVPIRTTPFSSRLRRAFSLTLGISRVNSSRPSLVSRISISNSSI